MVGDMKTRETETQIKCRMVNAVRSAWWNDSSIELQLLPASQCINEQQLQTNVVSTLRIHKHKQTSLASLCVLTEFSIWIPNTLCISPQHALDRGDINFTYIKDVIHSNELRLYRVGTKHTGNTQGSYTTHNKDKYHYAARPAFAATV